MSGLMNNLLEKLHLTSANTSDREAPQLPDASEIQELREKYEKADQGHVFHYWDELTVGARALLYEQLSQIDPEHVNEIANEALKTEKDAKKDAEKDDNEEGDKKTSPLEPLPDDAVASILDSEKEDLSAWNDQGLRLIADNTVAVVLMAGGQGTRLGSSEPKGCYNIGLPSEKSLFQLQAERIIKLQELAGHKYEKEDVVIPWYIMTSGPTTQATKQFFLKHKYFGLARENVVFFEQGILPCLSNDKKILLQDKSTVAVAPDGNGGLYQAIFLNSVIADMEKRGIMHIHAYCVDNCLVRVADPVFIGFAAAKEVDIATKVVRKRNAKESVGLILQKNGKPGVVEYSEMDSETAQAKDPRNSELLKFRAANIVNHYYSFSFLESIPQWAHKLPHHVAKKKIPYIDLESNQIVKPEKPNGIKLEQFVFDCFPLVAMDKFACMEVKREDEFSPLKNAPGTGEDDPESSAKDILSQGRRWLEEAGVMVESEKEGAGVEVSPLISYVRRFNGSEKGSCWTLLTIRRLVRDSRKWRANKSLHQQY